MEYLVIEVFFTGGKTSGIQLCLNYYNAWGLCSSEERNHLGLEIANVTQFTILYVFWLNGMIVKQPIGPERKKTKKPPPSPNNLGLDTNLD